MSTTNTAPAPIPDLDDEPNSVATTQSTAVVDPFALSADQLLSHGQAARDLYTPEDIALPFLTIIQDLSPQRKASKAEYIEAAKTGDIFNTVTQQLAKEVFVIPCRYQRRYVEWKPRDQGGGLVRDWGDNSEAYDAASDTEGGLRRTRSGNDIGANATYYVLQLDGSRVHPAILSMSSTQWKKARRWNSVLQNFEMQDSRGIYHPAPIFARSFRLSTVLESNASGDWYGWNIQAEKLLTEYPNGAALAQAALAFRNAVMGGNVTVAPPPDEDVPF
jgi:hypothetical protein